MTHIQNIIIAAIANNNNSLITIHRYVVDNYHGNLSKKDVNSELKNLIADNKIVKVNGSFRLANFMDDTYDYWVALINEDREEFGYLFDRLPADFQAKVNS